MIYSHNPAEVFSLSELMADEMEARGWTAIDVAQRMSDRHSLFHNGMVVNILLAVQKDGLAIDDTLCSELAEAFGTSADYWRNLDAMWRQYPDRRSPFVCPEHLFMPFEMANPPA